ncbi:MAG: T9SS type A sorting domain-containing protein [Bacteroidota bacterium]|nr:T9SS type A sorting domain-containing protein [Bacteroidota bacterium]
MKKLFIAGLLSLCTFIATAQDEQVPGVVTITADETYAPGQPIRVFGEYIPVDAAVNAAGEHTWSLYSTDEDGNVNGDPLITETLPNGPEPEYNFHGSEALPAERTYVITLSVTDMQGRQVRGPWAWTTITIYNITANSSVHCGDNITATGSFSATGPGYTPVMSYDWGMRMCDAAGNYTFPFDYFFQSYSNAVSGSFTTPTFIFPNSNQVACNTYWKIRIVFKDVNNNVLATRTKVIYITSSAITANNTFCYNSPVSGSGNYWSGPSNPLAAYHVWSVTPSNSAGYTGTNPATYGPQQTGTTINGTYIAANYIFPGNIFTFSSGSYYLLTVIFLDGNYAMIPNTNATKVIYISPLPQPTISGPASICGSGTYTAGNLSGSSLYNWKVSKNSFLNPWIGNTNPVTIPPLAFDNIHLQVTDANGCQSIPTSLAVTNSYVDPTFYYWGKGAVDASHFWMGFQRASNGGGDVYTVEEVNPASPYASIGTVYSNTCWGTSTIIYPFNYNGSTTGTTYNCTTAPYPKGYFDNNKTYKITRTINNAGCISTSYLIFDVNGVCSGCRMAQVENNPANTDNADNNFLVFPNPNNGTFQVKFNAPADNAQAELFNIMGERVDAFNITGDTYSYLPAQTLASGVYLLRINNNGTLFTKRIVVE